jgi:hypothetical protein
MPTAKPAAEPISVKPAVNPNTGFVTVDVFDGTRQLMRTGTEVLVTVRDGAQNQLFRNYVDGPTIRLELPFHNNFADQYTIVAFADGCEQAGFQPVPIGPNAPAQVDLMLLRKNGTFNFAAAQWSDILTRKPLLAQIFAQSVTAPVGDAYAQLMEDHPDQLACLLNLGDATSSFKQIQFGEANVQLTFHEKNRKQIGGVDCVYVEPDIDYYKDPAAHFLLEVLPGFLPGNLSSPRVVYVLRWIAGRHAGVPEFNPLYTIQ